MDHIYPSYDEINDAFDRIRAMRPQYHSDAPSPLERWVNLAGKLRAEIRSLERIAAYELKGLTPPIGYIDSLMSELEEAILVIRQRREEYYPGATLAEDPGSDGAIRRRRLRKDIGIDSHASPCPAPRT